MDQTQIREAVYQALGDIAPEAEPGSLKGEQPIRDQVEIDSFDFLQLLIRLSESTGVEIPESDYARVQTLDGLVEYIAERT